MSAEIENQKTIMEAYETLVKNCRDHHITCKGCPLLICDPKPRQPSGIPRYHCATFPGNNIPPAFWPELAPDNIGQVLDIDLIPQQIAIAIMNAGVKNPEGARAFFKLVDAFIQEAEKK